MSRRSSIITRLAPWALLAPALVIVLVFFALPAVYMLRMSFNIHTSTQIFVATWSLDNYFRLISDPVYIASLGKTLILAFVTGVVTVSFAYIFALFIWMQRGLSRLIYLAIALCPLLISEISVIFGWWMFFPNNGFMSIAMIEMGLATEKTSLMYTVFAALIGLTYITLPFAVFILLSVFDGVDRRILEASGDLGASPITTFKEVLFPLTRGGITVAFCQAFIWTMGTYATPSALGPDWLWTVGSEIYRQMNSWQNWPFASALAGLLIVSITAVMFATRRTMSAEVSFHA